MARDSEGRILHEAVMRRDAAEAATKYREDAVLVAPEGRFEGRDHIATFFRSWLEPYSDQDIEEWYRYERDGCIVVASTFEATHTGEVTLPWGGFLAPTGQRVSMQVMEYLVVDQDDVLVEHRFHYDRLTILTQLGAVPPPGS